MDHTITEDTEYYQDVDLQILNQHIILDSENVLKQKNIGAIEVVIYNYFGIKIIWYL